MALSMDSDAETQDVTRPPRRHRVAVAALLVAGTLSAFLAIAAIWISRQVLETDNWTDTSSELLQDEEIRTVLADFMVDQLYANVDVSGQIREALPPRAAPLAGPAAGALRNVADRAAEEALQRPRVQALWETANREAHEELLRIIEGGGDRVSTEEGRVTLNLGVILQDFANRTGVGSRVASKIGPDSAQIEVMRSDQLGFAQDVADLLKPLALVLTLLALGLFGGAIAASGDRRRQTLRAAGFGFIVAGVLALLLRSLGGSVVVDSLAKTESVRPAIESVWRIGTSLLVDVATASIIYGAVTVLGAWLAGPTRAAVASRRALAPYLREPGWAYGALAVFILLMIWWAPVPAARRVVPGLVLIALLVAGVTVLRRQTAREYPDAPAPHPGASIQRAYERLRGGASARREPARESAGNGRDLGDLERLADLHERGVLTDDEFRTQKRQLLGAGS